MADLPPLVLDIDGTLTRPSGGLDPRVFDPIREWPAPVVLATGKAVPYPVALCDFVGIDHRVVAENGGVVYDGETVDVRADPEGPRAVAAALEDAGHDLGWGPADPVNRWRETEVAVSREVPRDVLEDLAAARDLEVVDTGYAYHVKSAAIEKGDGVAALAATMGIDPACLVAVGDSENDVSTFETVGRAYAVENADERARAAADEVLDGAHAAGTVALLDRLRAC